MSKKTAAQRKRSGLSKPVRAKRKSKTAAQRKGRDGLATIPPVRAKRKSKTAAQRKRSGLSKPVKTK